MAKVWRGWLVVLAMTALGYAAFFAPITVFADRMPTIVSGGCQCTGEALRRLRTPVRTAYKIPPGFMQVTAAHIYGATPDHVEGTVTWRSLFGVPIGETRTYYDHGIIYHLDRGRLLGVWGLFLALQGVLGVTLFRQLGVW